MMYATRDIETLGDLYIRHLEAMTAENLYNKSAIAAELAWRDAEIDRLRSQLPKERTWLSLVIQSGDGIRTSRADVKAETGTVGDEQVFLLNAVTARTFGNMIVELAESLGAVAPSLPTPAIGVYEIEWLPDGGQHRMVGIGKPLVDELNKGWGIKGAE